MIGKVDMELCVHTLGYTRLPGTYDRGQHLNLIFKQAILLICLNNIVIYTAASPNNTLQSSTACELTTKHENLIGNILCIHFFRCFSSFQCSPI